MTRVRPLSRDLATLLTGLRKSESFLERAGFPDRASWFAEAGAAVVKTQGDQKRAKMLFRQIGSVLFGNGSFTDLPFSEKDERLAMSLASDLRNALEALEPRAMPRKSNAKRGA